MSLEALRVPVAVDGAPSTGHILVPMSALLRVPLDGAAVSGAFDCGLTFGNEVEQAFSSTVEYSANHGSWLVPSTQRADGFALEVNVGVHETARVWYYVTTDDGPAWASAEDVGDGFFELYPPLGETCTAYAVVEDDFGWATELWTLPVVSGDNIDCELFNWPGGWFRMWLDLEESAAYSRPTASVSRQGRLYEDTVPTGPPSLQTPVSGYLHEDEAVGNGGYADFYTLLRQEHVVWRSPRPGWARCVVTGGNVPRTRSGHGKVSVTLRTEDPS